METLITISNILLFALIVITPILILVTLKRRNTKKMLLLYSLMSLITVGVLISFFAWWSYESDLILLQHYGYNIDGMNCTEIYGHVEPHHMERVKSLETSIMGIGWPLKAIFGYLIYIPYLAILYIAN